MTIKLTIKDSEITIKRPTKKQINKLIDIFASHLEQDRVEPYTSTHLFPESLSALNQAREDQESVDEMIEAIHQHTQEDDEADIVMESDIPFAEDIPVFEETETRRQLIDAANNIRESYQESIDPIEPEVPEEPNEKLVYVDPTSKESESPFAMKMREAFQSHDPYKEREVYEEPEEPAEIEQLSTAYIESNDFRETGIKYRTVKGVENTPTYRTRWECPRNNCNGRGNHYVPEKADMVYCYECNAKLKVEDATALGFPNRDHYGNFYVATKEKFAHARA